MAAGEVRPFAIYRFTIYRFLSRGVDGGGGEIREERVVDEIRANVFYGSVSGKEVEP